MYVYKEIGKQEMKRMRRQVWLLSCDGAVTHAHSKPQIMHTYICIYWSQTIAATWDTSYGLT